MVIQGSHEEIDHMIICTTGFPIMSVLLLSADLCMFNRVEAAKLIAIVSHHGEQQHAAVARSSGDLCILVLL